MDTNNSTRKPARRPRLVLVVSVVAVLGVGLGGWLAWRREPVQSLRYGDFKNRLASRAIQSVRIGTAEITGRLKPTGSSLRPVAFRVSRIGMENDEQLPEMLQKFLPDGAYDTEQTPLVGAEVVFPLVLLGALVLGLWLMHRKGGGLGSAMAFAKSRHRYYDKDEVAITFADVAGNDEAVEELHEIVAFLKTPEQYQALGGRLPKGVLLAGPPGTGKTLLAKAVAGEAGVPFFSLSGSDFVEMFVGVGAARVRNLFAQADAKAPCLIFIDELDALGKARGGGGTGTHDERDQTLNQLLVEMDGFDSNRGVILMAATNRPEMLDAALVRPGRFDRKIVVDRPDIAGREQILKVHARKVALDEEIDLRQVAAMTSGFVGADLANLVNEAALLAARRGKPRIGAEEFEEGVERVIAGPEKKQRLVRADERRRIAFHEAGHAIVASRLPHTDPVHKVSIIGRGYGSLGYTLYRPEDDRYLHTRSQLTHIICSLLGGTIAEEVIYGEVSDGATSDLQRATQIARKMVTEFGMSGKLGRVSYQGDGRGPFGASGSSDVAWSEQTSREIDDEVRTILAQAERKTRDILTQDRDALEEVTAVLLEKETIDGAELRAILGRTAEVSAAS